MLLAAAFLGLSIGGQPPQSPGPVRLSFDQAHGESAPPAPMAGIAERLNIEIRSSTQPITRESLKGSRLLYLRAPSKAFEAEEKQAIVAFAREGGARSLGHARVLPLKKRG